MNRRELAQAMRAAIQRPEIIEDKETYITVGEGECLVCALGAGLVAHYSGDAEAAEDAFQESLESLPRPCYGYQAVASLLGISIELAHNISSRHNFGQSIEQIAQWLESDPNWAEGWEEQH